MARRTGERLTAADAANVLLDAADQVNVFLLAGLLGTGGFVGADGSLDVDRLRAAVAQRMAGRSESITARLGTRVRADGRRLTWEPCEPDLSQHVRVVDAVAGRPGLAALCARLLTEPLPLDRPLWELLVVPGADEGGPGVIVRMHHAVADGVAAVLLMQVLLGAPTGAQQPAVKPVAKPAPARNWRSAVTSLARVTALVRGTVPPTVMLGPISARRAVAFAEVELDRLAAGAHRGGGTVNDALLAAVAGAVRAALGAGGHRVPDELPASVPVALPERGRSGNAVGVMRVALPIAEPDVVARLARIAAQTRAAKDEARAQGTYELTRTRWGSRMLSRLARRQRFIALFVTNVRGPDEQLHLAGAPLRRAWPVAPIQGNVRLGVTAFSYRGRLACAVHVDAEALDADLLAATLSTELDALAR